MKRRLYVLLVFFLTLISPLVSAQGITVNGTVTDRNGMTLPGVNVLIKGTSAGTQTDFDGNFTIAANPGQTLVFSFLGMNTVELPATANMRVTLTDEAVQLEGVVVTALGIRREKASVGSATTTIRSDDITRGSQASLPMHLKERLPAWSFPMLQPIPAHPLV